MTFQLPEGTSPEIAEILNKPEVLAVVQKINEPLVAKRDELLGQISNLKKTINDFGGIDVIKTKLTAYEQAEADKNAATNAAALASNDVEVLKTTYTSKINELTGRLQAMEQEKVDSVVSSKIAKTIAEAKGVPELLVPFVKERIKVVAADGKVQINVLSREGGPLLNADGKDATLADLMNEFKNSSIYSRAFEADNKSGSGAKTNTGAGVSSNNPFQKGTPAFNVTEQMRLYKQDPQLAKQLAAQAGVTL